MKTVHLKAWQIVAIIGLCIAIVLCTIYVVCVANLFKIVYAGNPEAEAELDKNPYIHSNYAEWKEYKIEEGVSIRIPQNWQIAWNEDYSEITEGGQVIASGIRQLETRQWEGSRKEEREAFIADTVGFEPVQTVVDEDYFYPHTGQQVGLCKCIYKSEAGELKEYYELSMFYTEEYYYTFLFGPISEEGDEALLEKLVAVIFSYNK